MSIPLETPTGQPGDAPAALPHARVSRLAHLAWVAVLAGAIALGWAAYW